MRKGWQKKYLKDLCFKITDGTHKTPVYQETGITFLSAKNIKDGVLDLSEYKFISEDEHVQLIKRCKPEAGDVMLSKSGSLGDAIVVPSLPFEFSIFESLALLKVNNTYISSNFLKQYLNSSIAKEYFRSITSGIAVKHLHLVDLREMHVTLPPLAEQEKIAAILHTWDEGIEKVQQYSRALQARYKFVSAYYFDTLSQKEKWATKALSSLVNIRKGQQLGRLEQKGGDYPVWNGGVTPSGYTDECNASAETVTISEGGNSCGFVNFIPQEFWLGGHCYALTITDDKILKPFLYLQLKHRETEIMTLRVGSGLPNIQKKDLEKFNLRVPNVTKQEKVISVLKELQKQIDLQEKRKIIFQSQKRGLMQKLLTGEWPVRAEKEAA